MDAKLAKISLIVFIVAIFSFVVTFSMFLNFKERVCKVDINSAGCFEQYSAYMHNEFVHR